MRLVRGQIDWPGVEQQVLPHLKKAWVEGAHKDWSMEQILDLLRSGHWLLYGVVGAEERIVGAGVACPNVYGKRKVLSVLLFGADINQDTWVEVYDQLKQEAQSMGCSHIVGQGRPGWARALKAVPTNSFELEVT